jgi:hypothetical protein
MIDELVEFAKLCQISFNFATIHLKSIAEIGFIPENCNPKNYQLHNTCTAWRVELLPQGGSTTLSLRLFQLPFGGSSVFSISVHMAWRKIIIALRAVTTGTV